MQLPEPCRMQAINNAEKDDMLGTKAGSPAEALCAFPWETSPQGQTYWEFVFKKAKAGEFDVKQGQSDL